MAVTVSTALQIAAYDAAQAASDGTRNLTYMQTVQAALGSGYRRVLRRDGVSVWAATQSGLIPLQGTQFVTPAAHVQSLIAAADIDTGTWTHRFENVGDGNVYVECDVTPVGGGGTMTLSADLVAAGTVTLSVSTISSPSFDFSAAAFPLPSDSRTIAYLDPSLPWAAQNPAVSGGYGGDLWPQFNNSWFVGAANNPPTSGNRVAQIPEAGLVYSTITVIDRLADPADAAKQAFLHRLHPSVPTFAGNTARSAYLTPDYLPYDTDLWIAFAIRFSGWPGKTTTFFDVHDVSGQPMPGNPSRVSPHTQSPVQCWITSDGKCTWGVNGSYLPNYTAAQTTNSLQTPTDAVSAGSGTASGWHRYVLQFHAARSQSGGPFCRIWRQIDAGAETLLHDISGVPVGYYDTPTDRLFAKLGLYQFELPATDFTAHSKGLYVFRGETGAPVLSSAGLFAMLRTK